jgi:hypothetical protein
MSEREGGRPRKRVKEIRSSMPALLTTQRDDGTRPLKAIVGWAVIGALLFGNYVVFEWIGSDYVDWFIDNGTLIALIFALISAAVDLDRYPHLISAHPSLYGGACAELVASNILSWPDPGQGAKGELGARDFRSDAFDSFVGSLFGVGVALLGTAWILVVAPAQYLVVAVCGAPARMARASGIRTWVREEEGRTVITRGPRPDSSVGSVAIGIADKPVTYTNALGAAALWGLTFVT